MGSLSYPGKGKKIFIQFNTGILPNGHEFSLQGEALDPKSFSSGISGKYHNQRGSQIASILGLSMVAGVTEALTQKHLVEEVAGTTRATPQGMTGMADASKKSKERSLIPKSTMKNAFFHGTSKVSNMEAQRQKSELDELLPYITVPSGQTILVSLTGPIKGGFLEDESE